MTKLVWKCPCCPKDEGFIERGSQDHLDAAIANHIMVFHEERSALRAVDKARLECPHVNCEIGRKGHQNLSLGSAILTLTDFDKRLLEGMRISGDE